MQTTSCAFSLAIWATLGLLTVGCGHDEDQEPPCSEGSETYRMPFQHSLETDHVAIHTDGGELKTHIAPWGNHVLPHGGDRLGDRKADWTGYYAFGDDDPIIQHWAGYN